MAKIVEVIVKKDRFLSLTVNPLSLNLCNAVVTEKEFLSIVPPSLHVMDALVS